MEQFTTISLTVLYCLYAAMVCACCGLVAHKLLEKDRAETPTAQSDHLALSDFLLGCGFGPWCIGLLQLMLLIVCAGMPPLLIAGCSLVSAAAGLYSLRGRAVAAARTFRVCASRDRLSCLGAWLALGAVALVVAFSLRASSIPLWHGDTLIYAYEAKALRDGDDYRARLPRTPEPGAHNFIRNNDHPLTYIGSMASGLFFSPNRGQDLAMRAALQVQNVLLPVVLLGLGLRLGGAVGVLAPVLFLFYQYFGSLIDMAHRESFRVIPVLLCFGFLPEAGRRLRPASGRTALLLASMLFLWNAHTGSIAVAPVVLGCQLLALRDWRSRCWATGLCSLGFFLGANHLVEAYLKTGSVLGFEFVHEGMTHIRPPTPWTTAGPPSSGLSSLAQRFINQVDGDGIVAVGCVLLGSLGAFVHRRRLPAVVLAAAVFCLFNEFEVLGLLDWVHSSIGAGLYSVARYRFVLYPLGAILAGFFLTNQTKKIPFSLTTGLGVLLLAGGAASAVAHWERAPMAANLVRDASVLSRLDPMKSCWGAVSKHLGDIDPARPVILADTTMIPWYYTDWQVLNVFDPRLETARMTTSPKTALAELDRLHIGAVILNKAKFLSGTAIEAALESPAYRKFVDCIYDEGFRRVPGTDVGNTK